jgi:flagellar protein FliS
MSYGLAHARYASDAAQTVTPARLLTMLYDRLVLDLSVAEAAMNGNDHTAIGMRIGRAQEILLELHATLDLSIWPEGEGLARLYLWMVGELSQARMRRQPQRIADCRELVEPLRDAWHLAASGQTAVAAGSGPISGLGGAA